MEDQANGQLGSLACGGLRLRSSLLAAFASLFLAATAPAALAIENKPFIPPMMDPLPKGTRVNVDAARITYDKSSGLATALGQVAMTYGPYTLVASNVSYNQKTGAFEANGSVVLREPNGNVLEADTLSVRNKFKQVFARHIRALLTNDGIITADYVRRVDGDITVFENATYTACHCTTRSGHPLWEIDTDQTTHDLKTHNLYHVHPRFKLNGATVLALPSLTMPDPSVTRRSGFLAPDIKYGSDYGVGLVTPYFLTLGPSADLTFRPVWTTYQGPIADVEFRQATETGSYSVRGIGVHQFHDLAAPENGAWRGAVESKGAFKSGTDWTYGWDGTFATDSTFLKSYGYDDRKYAVNDIYATGVWDQTYVNAQMLNFGSLDTTVNPSNLPQAMPFITGETIMRDIPIGGQFDVSWNAYSLHRATAWSPFATVNQGTDQTRATTQFNWHRQFYGDSGTVITPFANLRGDMLIADNVPGGPVTQTSTTRVLPAVGVDARWPFVANLPFGQSIISPVMQIVAAANEGTTNAFGNEDSITLNYDHTSMFLADRFTGQDRYEGGTRADVGLTYTLIGNGGGFIRASAGQSFHIAGQNSFVAGSGLAPNESDLVAAVMVQPWDNFSLSYEARVKDDFSAIARQEAVASLSFDRFSTNISYLNFEAEPAYGRNFQEHWLSTDAKFALNNGWSLFGGMTYDFTASTLARKTVGLEFDCQCMNFKFYYQGTEDSLTHAQDNKIMMSVEFATLGKTGAAVAF